tara:strand:- start:1152 stop:1496 length:345 start_codon:yes stop_codon:yes gene_type:complete
MKIKIKLVMLLIFIITLSCDYEYTYFDKTYILNDVKIDDEGDFHFVAISNTGSINERDVSSYHVRLRQANISRPTLTAHYKDYKGNPNGAWISSVGISYTIVIPMNYTIPIFDD